MRTTVFSTPLLTPLLRFIAVILLKIVGWEANGVEIDKQRFVLIAAPHTSNWDFPLMLMVILKLRLRVFWMGKHTLFPFGFGWLMRWLGGIAINRDKSHKVVNEMVAKFRENEELVLLIPPEGTRSKVKVWKSGFYHIANAAEVPIMLGYVDAENKCAGMADFFQTTGDRDADMKNIRDFYTDKKGVRAENS